MLKPIFSLLFLFVLVSSFIKNETKDTIVWNESRPLTWDDFKGKPQRRFAAASTYYDIYKSTEEINNAVEIKIEAVFFPKQSWKKISWVSPSVLAHEQKHFDIDELFARQLRKSLKEHRYTSYEEVKHISDSLYTIIDKKMDIYQDKYDDETDSSMNTEKQHEWEQKINAELSALSAYKNTLFTVPLYK